MQELHGAAQGYRAGFLLHQVDALQPRAKCAALSAKCRAGCRSPQRMTWDCLDLALLAGTEQTAVMRIAHCQFETLCGDFEQNLRRVEEGLARAEKELIAHFMKVRSDHTARAIENSVWFVRGNNVVLDPAKSGFSGDVGNGYGDSYIMDPGGEIVVRRRRHVEDFIMADIDTSRGPDMAFGLSKSAWSYREFGEFLEGAAKTP